jgi:uridine kinase
MIIGIGGISNAGKSSLANLIKLQLENDYKVKILCQDDFILSEDEIPKINGLTDWEYPSSINHQMYLQAVKRENQNNDIVISEGLFAFYDDELSKLYDKKIFLQIEKEVFINRKVNDHRWGKVPEWYVEHIWNSYQKYGKAKNSQKVKTLNAQNLFDIDEIISYLKR